MKELIKIFLVIGCLFVIFFTIYFNITSKIQSKVITKILDNTTRVYTESVLEDSITKYNMAVKQNDNISACVISTEISQAYLQLKDDKNYTKWKKIEKQKCSWMY